MQSPKSNFAVCLTNFLNKFCSTIPHPFRLVYFGRRACDYNKFTIFQPRINMYNMNPSGCRCELLSCWLTNGSDQLNYNQKCPLLMVKLSQWCGNHDVEVQLWRRKPQVNFGIDLAADYKLPPQSPAGTHICVVRTLSQWGTLHRLPQNCL